MKRWLVRLYPRRWRARYGEELEATLADVRLRPAAAWDVVLGAVDAHVHRHRWIGSETEGGVMDSDRSGFSRWRRLAAPALLALPVVFLALLSVNGFGNGLVFPQLTGFFGNPVVELITVVGPFAALVLSVIATTRVSFERSAGSLVVRTRFRMTWAHGLTLLASASIITVYLDYYVTNR